MPHSCLCDIMNRFLGLELERPREIPPWAKAMANMDIPPWQKESPFKRVSMDKYGTNQELYPTENSQSTQSTQNTQNTQSTQEQRDRRGREDIRIDEFQPPGYFTGEHIPRRPGRLLPKHADGVDTPTRPTRPDSLINLEVKRSWPEPREKHERRIIAANYSAVEIHGFFGLIDDGSVGEGRMLIVHVPKWIRGYFLDIKQGDDLHVNHPKGKIRGVLHVLSTGRHKYYAPGRRVMTCTVCVSEENWAPFS